MNGQTDRQTRANLNAPLLKGIKKIIFHRHIYNKTLMRTFYVYMYIVQMTSG